MRIHGAISLVLIALALASYEARAEIAPGSASDLTEKVVRIEHFSPDSLNHLKALWQKKCGTRPSEDCAITEQEYLGPQGRSNRTLLFRGEPDRYASPGSSSLWRTGAEQKQICSGPCTQEMLSKFLISGLETLRRYAFDTTRSRVILQRLSDRRWFSLDPWIWKTAKEKDLVPIEKMPATPTHPASIIHSNVWNQIAENHIWPTGFAGWSENEKIIPLDPVISLSRDPEVGIRFGNLELKGRTGRVFILSVPNGKIKKLGGACSDDFPAASNEEVYDIRACNHGESYDDENELDQLYFLNSEYVLDVMDVGAS